VRILGSPCGDWPAAPASPPAEIPLLPRPPYLKWVYVAREDPEWARQRLPGNHLDGPATLTPRGLVCFPFAGTPEVVGCLGPEGALRYAYQGGLARVAGGPVVAPDGSLYWLGARGTLENDTS